jgi:hypothetical protein
MSTSAISDPNRLVPLSVGRASNAIELLVPPAPPIDAAIDVKARCFDFLADVLINNSNIFSSAELIMCIVFLFFYRSQN